LVEKQAVDSGAINGVPRELLTVAEDATVSVGFVSEEGKFKNSLGYYVLDTDGSFEDVGVVFADTSELTEDVSTADLGQFTAGQEIGFFLINQGATRNADLDPNESFSLVNADGDPASILDGDVRLFADDGSTTQEVVGDLFFTTDPTAGTEANELNDGGRTQALSGADAEGDLVIAFEDKNRGARSDSDFNDLLIKVTTGDGTTPPPTDGTQTVESPPVTLPDGQEVGLEITTEAATDDDVADLSGVIALTGFLASEFNIAFVNDASGSTSAPARDADGNPIDLDGDGVSDTIFAADVAALNELANQLADDGLGGADLGVISFGSGATLDATTTASDAAGIDTALNSPGSGGSTNYEAALQAAIGFFSAQPDVGTATNVVYFLSDGFPNSFTFDDEFAALTDDAGIDALVNAFGAGSGVSPATLDLVDNTGGSEVFTDLSQLAAGLSGSSLDAEDIVSVDISVNGFVQQTLDGSAFTETPTGLQFGPVQLTGLDPSAVNDIDLDAVITADDGSTFDLTLTTQILGAGSSDAAAADLFF
jgi:hypothetical protein